MFTRIGYKIGQYCTGDMFRLRYFAHMSAGLILFCFITDAHRYGAWYGIGVSYVLPYALPLICLAFAFPVAYACGRILRGYVRGSAGEVFRGIGLILIMSAGIALDWLKGIIFYL
jgi:hypothetical protein